MDVTRGPGILQRQVAFVPVTWVLRVQVHFFKIGRKSFVKVKAHLPQITYG